MSSGFGISSELSSTSIRQSGSTNNYGQLPAKFTPLSPSAEKYKQKKIAQAFGNINKLKFDSVGLVGREKETEILIESFGLITRIEATSGGTATVDESKKDHTRQMVLLGGESGSGKTALAEVILDALKKANGTFCRAKYDLKFQDSQPYSGISTACNEMCQTILNTKSKVEMATVRREIFEHIDESQLDLLKTMVPLLADVSFDTEAVILEEKKCNDVSSPKSNNETTTIEQTAPQKKMRGRKRLSILRTDPNTGDGKSKSTTGDFVLGVIDPKDAKKVLEIAIMRLVKILGSNLRPCVMFLDDLQWADLPSLELIERLIEDEDVSNLMVIGCYRSDEVDETHVLSKTMRALKEAQANGKEFGLSEIAVGAMSVESVNLYLQELLSISDPAKTQGLAEICHRRTLGNIFFIRVFLESLRDSGLLEYNTNIFQWTWNDTKIEEGTAVTDNVIGLLLSAMRKLPNALLRLLRIGACLGNTFDTSTVSLIWKSMGPLTAEESKDDSHLDSLFQTAVEELLFEVINDSSYRFVHDKVQEASGALVSKEASMEFQHQVGQCLYEGLDEDKFDQMLFVITDLLNMGNEKSAEMANLNLSAAIRSMELSTFVGATRYVEAGLRHLNASSTNDMWSENFNLALQLNTVGAEAESCLGDTEKLKLYCDEVINQKKALPTDKLGVYRVLFANFRRLDCPDQLVLDVLKDVGFKYPKNNQMQKAKAVIYLRDTMKNHVPTREQIAKLRFATDQSVHEKARLLTATLPAVLTAGKSALYVLVCCDAVRITSEHGLTEYSGAIFASFANVLMHHRGDWANAIEIASLALLIQDKLTSGYTKTSTIFKANTMVLGWAKPLKSRCAALMEGYQIGARSGNLNGASFSVMSACIAQLLCGSKLALVVEDCQIYSRQMLAWKENYIASMTSLITRAAIQLKETGSLGEERRPPDKISPRENKAKNWEVFICAHMGDYALGAELAIEEDNALYNQFYGITAFGFFFAYRAICFYASPKNNKSHIKEAKNERKRIRKFVGNGAANLLHLLHVLDAEDAVLRGKDALARESYQKAINVGARSGFIHQVGLACERYAVYLLSKGEYSDAEYYYNESIKYYTEWGSTPKVAMLQGALAKVPSK